MSRRAFEDKAISREDNILDDLINLAINRFKWTNLPAGLTSERLEEMLIMHGQLALFEEKGILSILPCYGTTDINCYNEYDTYHIQGYNGYTYTRHINDMVRLKNNPLATDDLTTLQFYAKKIDDIEQTQDVNLFQQCIPKIISGDKDSMLTVKNIKKQLAEHRFVIMIKDKITSKLGKPEVFDTSAPYLLDKLSDYEKIYWNKALTKLGINNSNIDKKERVIVDEVNSNNDYIAINLDLMYDMRVDFCNLAKEKFNIDIQVKKREVNEQIGNINDRRLDR